MSSGRDSGLSRRDLIAGGSAAGLALALGGTGAASGLTGPRRTAKARRVSPKRFTTASQLRKWQRELDRMGLRSPANPANEAYIDLLRERLEAAGVNQLRTERVPITRWTAKDWSLRVADGASPGEVATASFINYSGMTGPDGVTGRLVYVPSGETPAPGSLAGCVALFDVPLRLIPNPAFQTIAYEVYDPRGRLDPNDNFAQWQPGQSRQMLDKVQTAGAIGAVGIVDLPADLADGGLYPYDGVLRSVPGVFVNRENGARLRSAADAGSSVTVVLRASVRDTYSRNLVGIIPGRSRELMLLNSHTDGPNAIEDNGPNAIVAMCRYLTRLPRRVLPRTILVSLTTGHFCGAAGQEAFIDRHAEDLLPRVAGALTLEHLGALKLVPGETTSTPTGNSETGLFFMPETSALVGRAVKWAQRADSDPTLVARPITSAPTAPDGRGFPAEGNALWIEAGIPIANYIAGPLYLFNWGRSTMPYFDERLMRNQTIAFTEMLLALSAVPRESLRALDLLPA